MFMSRSVCTGRVLTDIGNRVIPLTPELSEKARQLYISAYGEARYARYNDTKLTRHGTSPPDSKSATHREHSAIDLNMASSRGLLVPCMGPSQRASRRSRRGAGISARLRS